jgi:hypothetical protein
MPPFPAAFFTVPDLPRMRDTVMPLTDTAIRHAKATDKFRKLADEKSLYLLIHQAGKFSP